MDLSKISSVELDARLLRLARTERKITRYVLWHVLEVMTRKLYLDLGYANIISYLVKHLGYCETSARNRVSSAELLRKAPAVVEKIESGDINLTQLRRHIREEEKKSGQEFSAEQTQDILQKIENKNSFDTTQTLALEFDRPLRMGVILTPQKDGSVRAEMTFTAEQYADISESQRNNAHVDVDESLPELFAHLARKDTRSKMGKHKNQAIKNCADPSPETESDINESIKIPQDRYVLETADKNENCLDRDSASLRTKTKEAISETEVPKREAGPSKRIYISVKLKRALLLKANHQCEFTADDSCVRFEARHALQVDHRIALALGGSHHPENLRVLCRAHNQAMARQKGLFRKNLEQKKRCATSSAEERIR